MCACRKAVLLDGGFSTQLVENVGEQVDGHPLWSARYLASHPRAIMQTHLDFLRGRVAYVVFPGRSFRSEGKQRHHFL